MIKYKQTHNIKSTKEVKFKKKTTRLSTHGFSISLFLKICYEIIGKKKYTKKWDFKERKHIVIASIVYCISIHVLDRCMITVFLYQAEICVYNT